MMMEMGALLAFAMGMIGLYLLAWLFFIPMKIVIKLLVNSAVGGLAVLILNAIGGAFGIHIALNFVTAAIVGILGVPGLVLCLLLF